MAGPKEILLNRVDIELYLEAPQPVKRTINISFHSAGPWAINHKSVKDRQR